MLVRRRQHPPNRSGVALLTLVMAIALGGAPVLADDAPPPSAPSTARGATEVELANLETAMTMAFLDTGVFHTLENLNDLPPGSATFHPFDDIDEAGLGTAVLLASTGRFAATRRHYTSGAGLPWRGPYASYQAGRIELGPPITYDLGSPLDLWGTPYRLYSPLGLVDPRTDSIVLDAIGDQFDRWAIVSAGPDGLVGTTDDIAREFGGAPTVTVVSSGTIVADDPPRQDAPPPVDAATARQPGGPGALLLVRGYRFGAAQGAQQVRLDGHDLGAAALWQDRRLEFAIPAPLAAARELTFLRDGVVVDRFALRQPSAATDWDLFE